MSPDDLAVTIAQRCHGRFSFEDAALVIEALAALNYTFAPIGTPGRYADSDEVQHALRVHLEARTGVHRNTVKDVLVAMEKFGYRPREPDQHPSGLRTTAHAFETVKPFGAAHTAAQKPIDNRIPNMGRNYA